MPSPLLPIDQADRALELLRGCAGADDQGYVHLQTIPYRGHHLSVQAVLAVSEPGDRVFEGGASSGYFASVLVAAGLRVDGHELDPVAAERARSMCEHVYTGDLDTFDVDQLEGQYQVLFFGDTLEHLVDPAAVLRRLRPRLRPGGALVVRVPNVANWAIRLSLLAGRFEPTDRGILDRTHLHFYTRRSLVAMLADAGFEVTSMVGSVPVPGITGRRAARLVHKLGNLRPTFSSYTFIVTARPVAA